MPSIGDKVAAIKQELGLSPTLTTAEAVAAALVDRDRVDQGATQEGLKIGGSCQNFAHAPSFHTTSVL